MGIEWMFLFAGAVALSAAGFVCVAILWLRKLRETVSQTVTEMADRQMRTTHKMNESIVQLQKQQDCYTQQIHTLAQAGLRLQHELSSITTRLEATQAENQRGGQTLH